MGWADNYIKRLAMGQAVVFRPRGNSMKGRVNHGQKVTVEPLGEHELSKGDVVLCTVRGAQYLHLVKGVDADRVLIGNNRGGTNGWTSKNCIYGVCTKVE